ncbi:MAG: leucine-rich repeat domain-containing protein [Treponema sp.]|nr:leucine-rich repeat domain-containing protein [Treponema sp.]
MKSIHRKTIKTAFIAFTVLVLFFSASCSTDEQGEFIWEKDRSGGIVITDYTGTDGKLEIPNQINGSPVRAIGEKAFSTKRLTSVIIPDSVTSIGDWAFASNELTNIVIGANVELEAYAFDNGFEAFYNDNGMMAGTYSRPDAESTVWTQISK